MPSTTDTQGKNSFKKFSEEEHSVWSTLFHRRVLSLGDLAHPLHRIGREVLGLSHERIPDFNDINKKLRKLTGWQIESTGVQYEEDGPWLSSLSEKRLRVTEYIRPMNSLDYTPLPDVFHDAFGHIPFLVNERYARIAHKFGQAYMKAKTAEERLNVANNWWYGVEFSFIKVGDNVKALGTGLISSEGELVNALSDKVTKSPYDSEVVGKIDRSAHKFHKQLFVLEYMGQLENAVTNWL